MGPDVSDNGKAALERAVQALYDSDPEREWVRMEHHRIEFAVTSRTLREHLPPPPARILDCGGGPGRYALMLAQQGYEVTLFDLSPELLVLAVEGLASGREAKVNALSGAAWDIWVDVNTRVARDPTAHSGAEHLLAICRRPRWRAVLRQVATRLAAHGVDYVVVGGAALALRGLPLSVRDLDLELPVEAIYDVAAWFEEAVVLPVAWRETETVRSHFGRLRIDEVEIDLIAGLERRNDDRWSPSFTTTRDTVTLEGVEIRTVELEEEVLAYLRRGRLDRAALALPHCDPKRLRVLLSQALRSGQL